MAYREFQQEAIYAAPSTEGFLDKYTQAVSNVFQAVQRQQENKRRSADQFKYDLSEGKFENDQKILTEIANNVVGRGKQEILANGRTSTETANLANQGKAYQQMSAIQFNRAKTLQDQILSLESKDKYYDGKVDLDKVKVAVTGENNDVNFFNRGQRLDEVEKRIGDVDAFKFNDYRADYVKNIGSQYKQKSSGDANVTRSNYAQATFWDEKAGKPSVTDEHAISFIKSDPQGRVEKWYDRRVSDQLDTEIERMIASGDSRVSWMKDKSKEEIKNQLISDPSLNIIDQKDFGVRKRELAKRDLQEADRINTKVDVEYKDNSRDANGGIYKNDNIVHSYSFNSSAVKSAVPGESFEPNSNPGPGGVLFQKNGKPMVFNSTNPVRTNINTGITNKVKIGSVPFNMTGYQLQAFKESGAPVTLNGGNTEELIQSIKRIPLSYFDPNGKYKLKPEMKIGLQGYTINQANILNAANNQEKALTEELSMAMAAGDTERALTIQESLDRIQGLKGMVGSGVDDHELALATSKAGIKGVQVNEVIEATDNDLANIKAVTQGFDLKNPDYWNDDMRRVNDAYKQRYQEATKSGYADAPPQKKTATKKAVTITPEEFNAKWSTLKSGESLTGPDGKTYTKK